MIEVALPPDSERPSLSPAIQAIKSLPLNRQHFLNVLGGGFQFFQVIGEIFLDSGGNRFLRLAVSTKRAKLRRVRA